MKGTSLLCLMMQFTVYKAVSFPWLHLTLTSPRFVLSEFIYVSFTDPVLNWTGPIPRLFHSQEIASRLDNSSFAINSGESLINCIRDTPVIKPEVSVQVISNCGMKDNTSYIATPRRNMFFLIWQRVKRVFWPLDHKVLDAGGGSVYLKSHRGQYLAIREDQNWGPGYLDDIWAMKKTMVV